MAYFNKDELFCSKCLIFDTFFIGGGSWTPSHCPRCNGTDCIMYQDLTLLQKVIVTATKGFINDQNRSNTPTDC